MTDRFDVDRFVERAAIQEFDGGLSRFEAETQAARSQGVERWEALRMVKEATDANGSGNAGGHGDNAPTLDRQRDANDMPGVQRQPKEKDGPVLERQPEAGRDSGVLLALRMGCRTEVQR